MGVDTTLALSERQEACQSKALETGTFLMVYQVRWQLVGRSGQPLDNGCIGESICAYGDAATAVAEFLRPYSEVTRCSTESYWLARRSREADLAVWVWIERHESDEAIEAFGIRMPSGRTADQGLTHLPK